MKAILMSIKPKWCEKIFSGEKTIEVRKVAPRLKPPFKVYIYETKAGFIEAVRGTCPICAFSRGKVIGEFVCDRVEEYEGEFWDDDTYERIQERWEPSDFAEYGEYEYDIIGENGEFYGKGIELSKQSCLSWNELRKYVGQGLKDFYGWHIIDPKLFDKPKELSVFWTVRCTNKTGECETCEVKPACISNVTRPPQSWMYVEEIEE